MSSTVADETYLDDLLRGEVGVLRKARSDKTAYRDDVANFQSLAADHVIWVVEEP